jgi:hypothetical protein
MNLTSKDINHRNLSVLTKEAAISSYRFLSDHWIGGQYYPAGTLASTADVGGTLPVGWQPSGSVEPTDAAGLAAFYVAGPQFPGNPCRTQFVGFNVNPPTTAWRPVGTATPPIRLYALSGLGAALSPVSGFE